MRDAKRYNPVTLADADKLTPNFSWTAFFKSQGVAAAEVLAGQPAFFEEVSKMLATPIRPHGGLPALPHRRRRLAVPEPAFVQENFGSTARPSTARRKSAALEARAGHRQQAWAKRSASCT
jgi:hypothetical protein